MLGLKEIIAEGQEAERKARKLKLEPIALKSPVTVDSIRKMPFLGDLDRTHNYYQVNVQRYLPNYPYKWFFVDSSGFGRDDESALSVTKFVDTLNTLIKEHGNIFGIGIAESGQFQVHIALYVKQNYFGKV
jgi:hypothetical protein